MVRPMGPFMSCLEMMIDVWKYIGPVIMGLGTVCRILLDYHNCAHSYKLTHAHTHTHTRAHTLAHSHTHTLTHSHKHTVCVFTSVCLSVCLYLCASPTSASSNQSCLFVCCLFPDHFLVGVGSGSFLSHLYVSNNLFLMPRFRILHHPDTNKRITFVRLPSHLT